MSNAKSDPEALGAQIAALSYEQAREELIKVVGELESGTQTLDAAMALWERGELLAQHCEQWLAGARNRLSEVKARALASDPSLEQA